MTWATFVPLLVFLGLSVLDLGPMYATDRCQTGSSLNAPAYWGGGNNVYIALYGRKFRVVGGSVQ